MPGPYPAIEPYDAGTLDVGDANRVYWEVCGNPDGKPAVFLHGGPGSGCTPAQRQLFDPDRYRIVLFDQRGCGRSTPDAGLVTTDLSSNTTAHLLRDIEQLRTHLDIERWLVFGGSWGSTLALAYAEQHPDRVSELVLMAVALTRRADVEWAGRGVGRYFPAAWTRFRDGVPSHLREGSLVDAYANLLADDDATVREQAARDWCAWEDAYVRLHADDPPNPRYDDPRFRMTFARLVTHYWRNAAFLDDDTLLADAHRLRDIPGVIVHGRLDLGAPLEAPYALAERWPNGELIVVDDEGHRALEPGMIGQVIAALDRFAAV
jgi:proline iminopeptidase